MKIKEGIIWIGTAEGGLNRLDPHTKFSQTSQPVKACPVIR